MNAWVVAPQMGIMFLFMLAGYVLTKKGRFSDVTSTEMSYQVIALFCPAMILYGVLSDQSVTPGTLLEMGVIVAVAYAFLLLLAAVMGPLLRVPRAQYADYKLMTVFGNIGFIGFPIINAVLGGKGMSYAVLFNLGFNLLVYTYGVLVLGQSGEGERQPIRWRRLINPGTIAGTLAILSLIFRPPIPTPVLNCLNYLGSIVTYMSVAIIGHTLAYIPLREVFRDRRIYLFVLLRCVLVPVLAGFVLKLFVDNLLIIRISVLILSMPVANLPMMMAHEAGRDTETLTKGIVVSTVLSIVTIILVTSLVEWF